MFGFLSHEMMMMGRRGGAGAMDPMMGPQHYHEPEDNSDSDYQ